MRAVRQSEMALKTHAANQEEPIHSQTSPAPKAVRIFAGSWDKPDGADEVRGMRRAIVVSVIPQRLYPDICN